MSNTRTSPSLQVEIAGLQFRNPVMAASGTFAYAEELDSVAHWRELGGVVCKGLSLQPREGNPPPRLVPTPSGMLNSVGLQNIGLDSFVADRLPRLRSSAPGTHLVANIFGQRAEDYARLAESLEDAGGLSALELNLSCPNVHGGQEFSRDPRAAAGVVSLVRGRTRQLRLFVKLAPDAPDLRTVARAVEEAGADALTIANTFPAMAVDVEQMKPALPRRTGGLSGPAVRPIILRLVDQVLQVVRIPVIGCGGVCSWRDALEYLMLGARGVQVGTAHFVDPRASTAIVQGLRHYLERKALQDINQIIGALQRE